MGWGVVGVARVVIGLREQRVGRCRRLDIKIVVFGIGILSWRFDLE